MRRNARSVRAKKSVAACPGPPAITNRGSGAGFSASASTTAMRSSMRSPSGICGFSGTATTPHCATAWLRPSLAERKHGASSTAAARCAASRTDAKQRARRTQRMARKRNPRRRRLSQCKPFRGVRRILESERSGGGVHGVGRWQEVLASLASGEPSRQSRCRSPCIFPPFDQRGHALPV